MYYYFKTCENFSWSEIDQTINLKVKLNTKYSKTEDSLLLFKKVLFVLNLNFHNFLLTYYALKYRITPLHLTYDIFMCIYNKIFFINLRFWLPYCFSVFFLNTILYEYCVKVKNLYCI